MGGASHLPFTGGVSWGPIGIEDYVPPQGEDHAIITEYRVVTPGYFEAMEIPMIRGRGFDERDLLDGMQVALIDGSFADTYFPERDPIGIRLSQWSGVLTIVGVIGTVKNDAMDSASRVTVYQPQSQVGARGMYMAVKTAGDPNALVASVTRAVEDLDENQAVVDVLPMRSRVADSLAERRFSMALLQLLSMVALILAGVGIYGLVSYRVNEGVRELGLRMALGAPTGTILNLVLRHGLTLASAGIVTGLAAAVALTGLMRSMLFGVSAIDGWTFMTVSAGLIMTTLIACYIPARRATMVDPLDAIKSE